MSKEAVKYLGTVLEQSSSGVTIAQSIIQKVLNLHSKKLLVMSLIQYHFDYACSFWYPGLSNFLRNRLQVTQNKVIRFVMKLDPRSHIGSDEFQSLGGLPVSKRVGQIILNHIFRIKSGTSPDYTIEHFIPASSLHSCSTRFRVTDCFLLIVLSVCLAACQDMRFISNLFGFSHTDEV